MPTAPFLRVYYLLVFGGLGLYLPFFPSWLVAQGFVGARMSLLVSLVPLLGFFSPPAIGMLADELGVRARMMVLTCTLSALGLTALAGAGALLSPLPLSAALVPMVVFATFRAPMVGLADALLLEHAADYGRVRLFGSIGFLLTAGGVGHFIDLDHPYQLPALIAAVYWVAGAISATLPAVAKVAQRPALRDARSLLGKSGFRWLLACVFLSFLSHSSYDLCASLRLRDLGESEGTIGLFWALGTFAEIFMMYGARTTIERWGPGRMLSLALVVHALRWTFLGQATNRTLILALQPLHAVTFALMWLSLMAALKKQLGVRGTATGQGLLAAGVAAGNTCGMWLWGLFYDRAGSELVFRSATVAALLGAACAVVLQRVSSREPRPEAVSNRA